MTEDRPARQAVVPAGALCIDDVVIFGDARYRITNYHYDGTWVTIHFGKRADNHPSRKRKEKAHPPMTLLSMNLLHVAVPYPGQR